MTFDQISRFGGVLGVEYTRTHVFQSQMAWSINVMRWLWHCFDLEWHFIDLLVTFPWPLVTFDPVCNRRNAELFKKLWASNQSPYLQPLTSRHVTFLCPHLPSKNPASGDSHQSPLSPVVYIHSSLYTVQLTLKSRGISHLRWLSCICIL